MGNKTDQPTKEELMADTIRALVKEIGLACKGGGLIEKHSTTISDSNKALALSVDDLASAIRELTLKMGDN